MFVATRTVNSFLRGRSLSFQGLGIRPACLRAGHEKARLSGLEAEVNHNRREPLVDCAKASEVPVLRFLLPGRHLPHAHRTFVMAVRSHPGAPRQTERGHDLPDHRLALDDAAVGEQGEAAGRIETVHPPARAVLVGNPLGNNAALLQARPERGMTKTVRPEARQAWDFGPRQDINDWLPVDHKEESDPGHICLLRIGSGLPHG